MNQPDPSQIFTQSHRIYIRGVRHAIAERLQSAYGADWWQRGVLVAIGENQQANLERELAKPAPHDLPQLLDTPHFPRIAQRHQAAAFADAFTDLDRTLALFRYLAARRNEWAHVRDSQWTTQDALQAVQAMQEILISLRRPEALELHKMFQESLAHTDAIPQETLAVTDDPPAADDADSDVDERSLLGFWRSLESYLAVESSVQAGDEKRDRRGRKTVTVLVRVTNTAPTSDGRPHIRFGDVELRYRGNNQGLGSLGPGEAKDVPINFLENELPSIQFRVSGRVDLDALFSVKRQNALPDEIVAPLLERLNARFNEVGIEETLEKVIAAAAGIQPDLTLAEVSARRAQLGELKPIVAEKRKSLDQIFSEYRLDKESPLGEPLAEVVRHLQEMENTKFAAMDAAISNTDLPAIRAVARDFQQLQISVLRARENIRRRMARLPVAANAAAW